MTDPTPAPAPTPDPSPLGVDPVEPQEPSPNTPAEPAAPDPAPGPAPTKIELTAEEHAKLLEKAQTYDIIDGDPAAAQMLNDYFRSKARTPADPNASPDPKPDPSAPAPGNDEIGKLRQEILRRDAEHARQLAELQVEMFRRDHSDFDTLRKDMVPLVNRGIPLNEAYAYAKAKAQAGQQQPSPAPTPAEPTTEGKSAGVVPSDGDLVANALKRINDPAATQRIDDAFDVALEAAMKLHGQ